MILTTDSGSRVLIVETEHFISTELERVFMKFGAAVLGSARSMSRAIGDLDQADAANIDGGLDEIPSSRSAKSSLGGTFPLSLSRIAATSRFRAVFAILTICRSSLKLKPTILKLFLHENPLLRPRYRVEETVFAALHQLRVATGLHVSDVHTADRLSEIAQEQPITHKGRLLTFQSRSGLADSWKPSIVDALQSFSANLQRATSFGCLIAS